MSSNTEYIGTSGNDTIKVANGTNTITGGLGDDTLEGGLGFDNYVYNRGDGHDIIHDNASAISSGSAYNDRIIFGEGITEDDLVFSLNGSDLVITFKGTETDSIRIVEGLTTSLKQIEYLYFADGHSLHIQSELPGISFTENADVVDQSSAQL
ncbi:calcium-binding protein, partial [Halodesulfovibrio aestuarii]